MVNAADLTKPVVIPTLVPAPAPSLKFGPHADAAATSATIELRACSELTEYAAPLDYFTSGGKLKAVQRPGLDPVIFTIGSGAVCVVPKW